MMPDRPDELLAAEYVLGLIDGPALTTLERRLRSDAGFAREVEAWRTRFADFDHSAETHPVGADIWRRIEQALPTQSSVAAPLRSSWREWLWNSLPVLRATAVGASLAVLVLAAALGVTVRQAGRAPAMIAVLLDGDRPGAVVEVFADGRATLMPISNIPVPLGRVLQVWTLPSKERGPVSVGLMPQAQTLPLTLTTVPQPQADQLFEITLEPEGGSPTGRPTGPVLFKGNTARRL
jgi:anti-sigma-K factor RskA